MKQTVMITLDEDINHWLEENYIRKSTLINDLLKRHLKDNNIDVKII